MDKKIRYNRYMGIGASESLEKLCSENEFRYAIVRQRLVRYSLFDMWW